MLQDGHRQPEAAALGFPGSTTALAGTLLPHLACAAGAVRLVRPTLVQRCWGRCPGKEGAGVGRAPTPWGEDKQRRKA